MDITASYPQLHLNQLCHLALLLEAWEGNRTAASYKLSDPLSYEHDLTDTELNHQITGDNDLAKKVSIKSQQACMKCTDWPKISGE